MNAADYSHIKRNRAYWSNFLKEAKLPERCPRNPNGCMAPGRTVQTYMAYGLRCVRPIEKSWKGDPDSPVANTARPVLVNDELFDKPQQLLLEEAEALMGMRVGCTAAEGITAADRLRAISDGWDVNVTTMPLSQSRLVTEITPQLRADRAAEQCAKLLMVEAHEALGDEGMASLLLKLPAEHFQLYLTLLMRGSGCDEDTVLDSGSARHLHNSTTVLDGDNRMALTGFDGSR